ncbi:MAG: hypothetical protein ACOWWH_00910 [Eubacteriaceae bacterium]
MNNELQSYCKRAVIRYLNGDMKEFNRLVSMAMNINKECVCSKCGNMTVPARIRIGKGKSIKIELCTHCGLEKEKAYVS